MSESATARSLRVLVEPAAPPVRDHPGHADHAGRVGKPTAAPLALVRRELPALRLLPAPASEPPYDDELPAGPRLRLVPPPTVPPGHRHHAPGLPLPRAAPALRTPTDDLPDARPFARALVQRLLEVCGGVRPVPQLQRDTTPALYADLERALTRRRRPSGPRPSTRDVRSVHVQERPDGIAEVCATVRRGDRVGALAMRLEGVQGRWLCTHIQGV